MYIAAFSIVKLQYSSNRWLLGAYTAPLKYTLALYHISEKNQWIPLCKNSGQWCSQNAEKVMNTKGRLLDQAVILKMGTSLTGKNLLPEGVNSFL